MRLSSGRSAIRPCAVFSLFVLGLFAHSVVAMEPRWVLDQTDPTENYYLTDAEKTSRLAGDWTCVELGDGAGVRLPWQPDVYDPPDMPLSAPVKDPVLYVVDIGSVFSIAVMRMLPRDGGLSAPDYAQLIGAAKSGLLNGGRSFRRVARVAGVGAMAEDIDAVDASGAGARIRLVAHQAGFYNLTLAGEVAQSDTAYAERLFSSLVLEGACRDGER